MSLFPFPLEIDALSLTRCRPVHERVYFIFIIDAESRHHTADVIKRLR